jgi:flagellar biosynthesis chaperone FliJ
MRPFRFRADIALQLRRREHDQAVAHLARARGALAAAESAVDEAARAITEVDAALAADAARAAPHARRLWYQSWRLRWTVERDRRNEQRGTRANELHDAEAVVRRTHQRVRSLERLHDLSLAAWRRAADQEERKAMDAIATARFTRRKD